MFIEDEKLAMTIGVLAGEACTELFHAYGVELSSAPDGTWGQGDETLLSGVMGFVGPKLRGTCLLACGSGTVLAACPEGGKARDWVGELCNQLVGRLKSKLLARDADVSLTTPIVLRGVRLEPLPRIPPLVPKVYASEHGPVLVWVEVEGNEGAVLAPEGPPMAGDEGEVYLF